MGSGRGEFVYEVSGVCSVYVKKLQLIVHGLGMTETDPDSQERPPRRDPFDVKDGEDIERVWWRVLFNGCL